MAEPGRPAYNDDQYKAWLEDMRPFLVLGCSLNRAMERAGLLYSHETTIREKYRLGDWFSRKIDALRATPGENINEALVTVANKAMDKAKQGESLTHDEIDVLKHMSEKHRTAQPFFVTRTETAESKPEELGKIVDILEGDYGEFNEGPSANASDTTSEKQEVANDAPVQNQG